MTQVLVTQVEGVTVEAIGREDYIKVGECGYCGAPIHMYGGAWGSILPPPKVYSCSCVRHEDNIATINININVNVTGKDIGEELARSIRKTLEKAKREPSI